MMSNEQSINLHWYRSSIPNDNY